MSSFAGRELLNPANVMEASYDAGTTLQQDNGLNFLGKEVDTGVRAGGEKQRQSNRTVSEPLPPVPRRRPPSWPSSMTAA